MSRFWRFVENYRSDLLPLPLTHATDGYVLREVLEEGRLEAKDKCRIFNELLLYFFYGCPSYRVGKEAGISDLSSEAPVCLILKPDLARLAKRMLPFDSGGFDAGRFSTSFHRRMKKEHFFLQPSSDAPARVIKAFFGTNEAYFDAQPLEEVLIPPVEFEAESYRSLISGKQREEYDDRISAIEIQIETKVPLAQNLLAIVLPSIFADELWIRNELKRLDVEPLVYTLRKRMESHEYSYEFFRQVRDYLARFGCFGTGS